MRTFRVDDALISVAVGAALVLALSSLPAKAQAVLNSLPGETAVDAALNMANVLDGAGGGISSDDTDFGARGCRSRRPADGALAARADV